VPAALVCARCGTPLRAGIVPTSSSVASVPRELSAQQQRDAGRRSIGRRLGPRHNGRNNPRVRALPPARAGFLPQPLRDRLSPSFGGAVDRGLRTHARGSDAARLRRQPPELVVRCAAGLSKGDDRPLGVRYCDHRSYSNLLPFIGPTTRPLYASPPAGPMNGRASSSACSIAG
jgi:hypothetical protein